jgi:hypothetical protein
MRALRIPSNPNQPLEIIELDGTDALGIALEGTPEPLVASAFPGLRGYRNGDANVLAGIASNLRASRLFGRLDTLGGSIAGDVIVVGHTRNGAARDCPPTAEQRLHQSAALGEPERVPCDLRRARLRWITTDDRAGKLTGADLETSYRPGLRSHATGRRVGPNQFVAELRWISQEPGPAFAPGTIHGQLNGDGLWVARETVPRYTRRGLAQFTELAVARVQALAAAGDDRIAPYFT